MTSEPPSTPGTPDPVEDPYANPTPNSALDPAIVQRVLDAAHPATDAEREQMLKILNGIQVQPRSAGGGRRNRLLGLLLGAGLGLGFVSILFRVDRGGSVVAPGFLIGTGVVGAVAAVIALIIYRQRGWVVRVNGFLALALCLLGIVLAAVGSTWPYASLTAAGATDLPPGQSGHSSTLHPIEKGAPIHTPSPTATPNSMLSGAIPTSQRASLEGPLITVYNSILAHYKGSNWPARVTVGSGWKVTASDGTVLATVPVGDMIDYELEDNGSVFFLEIGENTGVGVYVYSNVGVPTAG